MEDIRKERKARHNRPRVIKGIILLVAAALSLAAGIYKGGEGLFFGVVFGMACGLLGVLYVRGESTTAIGRKK